MSDPIVVRDASVLGPLEASRSFESFYDEESRTLFRRLWLVTGSRAEAEELMQDAFLRVWGRHRVGGMEDPVGYLYRTAVSLFRKRYRRAVLAIRRSVGPASARGGFVGADDRQTIGGSCDPPPRQLAALVLTGMVGFTAKEAGDALGCQGLDGAVPLITKAASRSAGLWRSMMPNVGELLDRESRTVDLEHGDFERLARRRERRHRNRLDRRRTCHRPDGCRCGRLPSRAPLRARPAPNRRTKRDVNRRANSDEWIVDLVSLREGGGSALHRGRTWTHPQDAPVGWVDVTRVRFSTIRYNGGGVQPGWSIQLAAKPPPRRVVNRDCASPMAWCWTRPATGLPTTWSGSTTTRRNGRHVWVTDVATGKTEEHRPPVRLSDRVQSP